MKAKEYLLQIKKLDKLIENKQIEIEQWKAIATGITANLKCERVQSSVSQHKMEDAICRYVEIEQEINSYIDELVNTKKDVIKMIEQLNINEYDILHKVYVQYITLNDVADMYNKTYTWATTTHVRALNNLQKILNSKTKENHEL